MTTIDCIATKVLPFMLFVPISSPIVSPETGQVVKAESMRLESAQ